MSDQKITSTTREGDFIHENLEMGKEKGFRNVASYWLDHGCISYDRALELVEADKDNTTDMRATLSRVEIIQDDTQVVFRLPGQIDVVPTDYALRQFGASCGVGTHICTLLRNDVKDYSGDEIKVVPRDETDAHTLVTVLNNAKRRMSQDKIRLFRTRDDGTMRAFLSNQYGIIENKWVLELYQRLIPDGLVSHWKGDSDTVFGNILIPDSIREEDDSDYGGMVAVINSEIGQYSLSQIPSLFRAICMNGCIWGATKGNEFKKIHKAKNGHIDFVDLAKRMQDSLDNQIPLIRNGQAVDKILSTKSFKYDGDSMDPLWSLIRKENTLNKKQATLIRNAYDTEVRQCEDNKRTLFGVINAVTRAAQLNNNATDWRTFEQLGGDFLNYSENDWDVFTSKAKLLKADEVEKSFAVSV